MIPPPLTEQEQADAVWVILEREFETNPVFRAAIIRDVTGAKDAA